MYRNRRYIRWIWGIAVSALCLSSCTPSITEISPELDLPEYYLRLTAEDEEQKIRSLSSINWQEYFSDSHLKELITTALRGNQELDILLQELEIAKNEVSARHGAVLPSVELGVEAGLEKVGELTRDGAVEQSTEIAPGKSFPDPLKDFTVGAFAHWEVDIWRKLRNAEKAAVYRYSATVEGRNFFITQLVAEVANIYYELIALDWQLKLVEQNIGIQTDALTAVRVKKESARVTELALRRFEAQLFKTKGLRYDIQQKIIEKENEINFLLGRYPVPIIRSELPLDALLPGMIDSGVPLELLQNRPDVRQAEQQLAAAELDIEVARARFYPSLQLSAGAGYSAYRTEKLFESPTSLFYSLAGGLTAPFLNRRDIEAEYKNASAAQRQAVRNYEQTVLRAYIEVENQLAHLRNLKSNVGFRSQEVKALDESIQISTTLFNSARADYMEVLLTQREALDSKFDLIETKQRQLRSAVELYRALGGGWSAEEKEEVRPSHSASSGDRVL